MRINSNIKNGTFPDGIMHSIFAKIRAAEAKDKAQSLNPIAQFCNTRLELKNARAELKSILHPHTQRANELRHLITTLEECLNQQANCLKESDIFETGQV